jgi:hypothetical protein
MATKLGNWVANVAGLLAPEATRQAFAPSNAQLKNGRRIAFQGARQRAEGLRRAPYPAGLRPQAKPKNGEAQLAWKDAAIPLAVLAAGLGAVALATRKRK